MKARLLAWVDVDVETLPDLDDARRTLIKGLHFRPGPTPTVLVQEIPFEYPKR